MRKRVVAGFSYSVVFIGYKLILKTSIIFFIKIVYNLNERVA